MAASFSAPCPPACRSLSAARPADAAKTANAATRARPAAHLGAHALPKRNVVLAVDASDLSLNAWQWTLDNLWSQGTALHLLHVVPDIQPCSPASGSVYYPQPETDHERDAELVWRAAQEFLKEAYVAPARERGAEVQIVIIKEHRHKHIGWAVCAKAEELAAEPLVLAVHDQSFWEDLFLGSVSKFALKHCKCPVLLLHPSHSTLAA